MTTVTQDALQDAEQVVAPPPLPPKGPLPQLLVLGGVLGAVRGWVEERLGMDYRSLALLRICMGALVMWVAYTHGIEAKIFYTDDGVMPRSTALGGVDPYPPFSLHFAHGGMAYITTLFILQFVLGFMMMVGYRTRIATIGSYILLLSMQNRHPILLFGADIVMRVSLFWTMFLPLAERYSIDHFIGRTGKRRENRAWWAQAAIGAATGIAIGVGMSGVTSVETAVIIGAAAGLAMGLVCGLGTSGKRSAASEKTYLGIAGIAFFLQFASIYVVTSLMKNGDKWQVDHTAVSFALALDIYSRPMGHWLAQYPTLTRYLTISTLYVEFYGPYLFIFPVFNKWTRMLAILVFGSLQIGFGLCMFLGIFGWVMIAITLPFLPAMFWDRFAEPLGRKLARWLAGPLRWIGARLNWFVRIWRRWVEREQARNSVPLISGWVPSVARCGWVLVRDGTLVYLAAITLLWNAGSVPGQRPKLTEPASRLLYLLGLNQTWDMFAPNPQNSDGWYVIVGTKWNGDTVDLISGASPASFDKPDFVAGSYRNQLWMSYLISLGYDGADTQSFAVYLGNQWNETHYGDDRLQTVEINQMLGWVEIGPDKQPVKVDAERNVLWTEWFYR